MIVKYFGCNCRWLFTLSLPLRVLTGYSNGLFMVQMFPIFLALIPLFYSL